jgi:hypothetical protein
MHIPVLLTSCVYVSDQSVFLSSPQDRINHTLKSIEHWLEQSHLIRIVICDNSGYDFSSDVKKLFPNKEIECLSFLGDKSAVSIYGKGFGEGEIIEFAIASSKIISTAKFFAKCTAKLWVNNPEYFLKTWTGDCALKPIFKNVFSLKSCNFHYVDTRFYLVSVDFYSRHFKNLHKKLKKGCPIGIEQLFLQAVFESKLKNIFWNRCPEICGVSGASGKVYRNSIRKKIKERLRYFLMKKNTKFKNLFIDL